MTQQNLALVVKQQLSRIQQLESEVLALKQELKKFTGESTSLSTSIATEFVANKTLKKAIEQINNHKWVEAATIIADQYGKDFMVKDSPNFDILKKAMYEFYEMPQAPYRFDKSTEANADRERRKAVKATVYTYIDRMGKYYLK